MSDVVLVYPCNGFDVLKGSVDLPLSVLSAACLVSQDFSVKIIDQRTNPDWKGTLIYELAFNPLCVGISSMSGPQLIQALGAAKIVREWSPDVPIVWGGVHATIMPEKTLQDPLVDIVVIGEGEVPLLNLVCALADKSDLSRINGIGFKRAGKLVFTYSQTLVDLNTLPDLPYHLVDVEKYVGTQGRFADKNTRALGFLSSRGCPHHCGYCSNKSVYHSTWRCLDAEKTYERISKLVREYKLDSISFIDDELFIDRKRAERIADLIGGRFTWSCQSRMDSLVRINLPKMEQAGLRAINPGIESGSPRILKLIQKGETVDVMLEVNRRLAETSIKPLYNFIMGFPTETYSELMESVDLASKLLDENPNAEITAFFIYVPYPGTDLYELSVQQGFEPPTTMEGWGWIHRQHLITPWVAAQPKLYSSISIMSKFIDGTRMIRRLRDHSHVNPVLLFLLRCLTRLHRYYWRRHKFTSALETKVLNWINKRFFHW